MAMSKMRRQEALYGYLFILPWAIGFLLFTLGPMIASLVFSTWKWDLLDKPTFVGLRNYAVMLKMPDFWHSLGVTSYYSFARLPLVLAAGLLLALMLNQRIRPLGLWRTIFYLPSVLPMVAVSMLFIFLYNPDIGVINFFIQKIFGVKGPRWIFDERTVIPSLILMSLWWVGSNMLIYLGGLQGIPTELYEAAAIDGAGVWSRFWRITLPMISPVIFYNLITTLIASFETFTQVYVMLGNRPMWNANFFMIYLYNHAFRYYKMGYASALAWVFFIILFGLTLLTFKSSSFWVYYEAEVKGGKKENA
ncbi:MAG: sugar ABC transporter permease [Firmicutes bacterium]|nr:sugar ABC transporter permease [Bacillota bacterium]